MRRIVHDFKSYLRSIQISRYSVFIFVEGKKIDPYFYGKIADSVCQSSRINYTICKANELSGQGGGKPQLLSFFQYLRKTSSLIHDFKGSKKAVIFYLDKDVDDILRNTRKSSHVVYTDYYDVYNHIFVEGNISEALAAAASLDPKLVKSHSGDCQALRCQLAHLWKDWVKLCLFTSKRKINCRANYGVKSQVNNSVNGSLNINTYNTVINELKSQLGLSDQQFKRAFNSISLLVDEIYSNGHQDRVFKGKWYCFLFNQHIKKLYGTADCNGLDNRLPSNLVLTLDCNQPWAEHFKQPLRQLFQLL